MDKHCKIFGFVIVDMGHICTKPTAEKSLDHIDGCCDTTRFTAREQVVPCAFMRAVSLIATERSIDGQTRLRPRAVNMEGAGQWFATGAVLPRDAQKKCAQKARSSAAGCLRLVCRWYGHYFSSVDEMINPVQNARYTARFLLQFLNEFGLWPTAVVAYRLRTINFAKRYKDRVLKIYSCVKEGAPLTALARSEPTRLANLYIWPTSTQNLLTPGFLIQLLKGAVL